MPGAKLKKIGLLPAFGCVKNLEHLCFHVFKATVQLIPVLLHTLHEKNSETPLGKKIVWS